MAANGEFSVVPMATNPRRQRGELVAVGIPDGELPGQLREQTARALDPQRAIAVLAALSTRDRAAQQAAHELDPVADTQHRDPQIEDRTVGHRRSLGEHAARPAG